MPDEARSSRMQILRGAAICFGLNLLILLLGWALIGAGGQGVFWAGKRMSGFGDVVFWVGVGTAGFPGLWQLVDVLPLERWYSRRGRHGELRGLIIAASVTVLLNAGCAFTLLK